MLPGGEIYWRIRGGNERCGRDLFTAGIGENSAETRAAVCEYLGYLGIGIDEEQNKKRGEDVVISTPDSKVKVMVIPTNEELAIARETAALV